jgi:hypothetical protein
MLSIWIMSWDFHLASQRLTNPKRNWSNAIKALATEVMRNALNSFPALVAKHQ